MWDCLSASARRSSRRRADSIDSLGGCQDIPPYRAIAYEGMQQAGWDLAPEEFDQVRRLAEAARELPLNRGRKGYPADHYRRIAVAYIDQIRAQGSRGVLARLADDLLGELGVGLGSHRELLDRLAATAET
jgi:hypothetical protein